MLIMLNTDEVIACLRQVEEKRYDAENRIDKRFQKTNTFNITIAGGKTVNAVDYANVMVYFRIKMIAKYASKPVATMIKRGVHAEINMLPEDRQKHWKPADYFEQSGFSACGMSHTFDTVVSDIKRERARKLKIFARLGA